MPYTNVDDEVTSLVQKVLKNWHLERLSIEKTSQIDIGCIFYIATRDLDGHITGQPLKLHGYAAAAIIKVNSEKHRAQGLSDASIVIDGDGWKDLNEQHRIALIDHELEHLDRVYKEGVPQDDDLGRPKLRAKLHDWQLGGFKIIAERHHEHALEVINAKAFADEHGQLLFGFTRPPSTGGTQARNVKTADGRKITPDEMVGEIGRKFKAAHTDPGFAKAVKQMATLGSGIDSITMSLSHDGVAVGKSVTIDRSNSKRIRDNCDKVIAASKKQRPN